MSFRVRCWLRRHPWFWWIFAAALATGSAVLTGFVCAGYRPAYLYLVLWAGIPIANSYVVWFLTAEAETFKRLLSSAQREDVPAPR